MSTEMNAAIVSGVISALVSLIVLGIGQCYFGRNDRRFPILTEIQKRLLNLQENVPSKTNGDHVLFEDIPQIAKKLKYLYDQLSLVSWPIRNCDVRRAYLNFESITEEKWNEQHPLRTKYQSMTKEEFRRAVQEILNAIAKG